MTPNGEKLQTCTQTWSPPLHRGRVWVSEFLSFWVSALGHFKVAGIIKSSHYQSTSLQHDLMDFLISKFTSLFHWVNCFVHLICAVPGSTERNADSEAAVHVRVFLKTLLIPLKERSRSDLQGGKLKIILLLSYQELRSIFTAPCTITHTPANLWALQRGFYVSRTYRCKVQWRNTKIPIF